jgi:hypothetical protein
LSKPAIQSQPKGTIFTIFGSPNVQNRNKDSPLSDQKVDKSNDETKKLNGKFDSSDSCATNVNNISNDNCLSISENENQFKDVKVSVNEKLNFKLSVPQELPIQSIKEFCRGMIEDKEVNQTAKQNQNIESKIVSNNSCFLPQTKDERRKQLQTLKSPTIVKEVMKKIASIPSGGFEQNVDITVTESQSLTTNGRCDKSVTTNGCQVLSSENDTEAMLVIQELDRSIAEGSPSSANSPVIVPRICEKKNNENKLIKTTGLRPNKPPRLLSSINSIDAKRQIMIERTETQTDNLIEEVYLADENGTKSQNELNIHLNKRITETFSQQKTKSLSSPKSTKEHESETPYNNIQNVKNGNNLNLNCNTKREISAANDLECGIARASLRYACFQLLLKGSFS